MQASIDPKAFEARVEGFLSSRGLSKAEPALVALSGGPDSTALLAALAALGAGALRAVHVDHGLRPRAELDAERDFVRGLCRGLGVPLTIARLRPGAVLERARADGEGVEAAARRFRYAAFRAILAREGLSRLYLAHNRDDQLETILMRFLAGSGPGGLRGMPEAAGPILRPLLSTPKSEILAYLAARGLGHSQDSTNDGDAYLRNRVRRGLVPVLDERFPGWGRGLLRGAELAALDEEALAAWAVRVGFAPAPAASSSGAGPGGAATPRAPGSSASGRLEADAASFFGAPEAVRRRALLQAMSLLGPARPGRRGERQPEGRRLPARLARAALLAASSGGRYRGAGIELRLEEGRLILSRSLDFPKRRGYFVVIERPGPGGAEIHAGSVTVAARWSEGPDAAGLDEGAFTFPLVARSRRPGDALSLRRGRKPLDELLSEWGLPAEARGSLPVIEDRDGIVAVLGSAWGGRDRFRHCGGGLGNGRKLSIAVKGALA